ncbi:hypothetical protein C7999DRAFT_34832, partial [Corynascus novoguineensis]
MSSICNFVFAFQLASSVLAAAAGPTPSLRSDLKGVHSDSDSHSSCKAVPGSPDWPSPQDWKRLNESVTGRLLRPTPPAAVCHSGQGSFNSPECAAVREGWSDYTFHQADPVSVDWNNWANDTCLPIEGAPCSGQGYPVFLINATEARHVQSGVQFAKKHNIRLVIKSTGHDYMGRSNAPNSLSIWTHYLKDIKTHKSFRPKHCNTIIDTTVVTVGAGVQLWDLYNALDLENQTVVGGSCKTVSVGGYVTGGGHGLLSSTYGMAADEVLEMELVTADGDIVTANECQNKDLFWAMRGGGVSTFGVLTSVTMKTHPTPNIEAATVILMTPDVADPRPIFDMTAYVVSQLPDLGDQGLAGYTFIRRATPNPFDGGNTTAGGLMFVGAISNSPPQALRKLWDPILAHVNATWPNKFAQAFQPKSYPTFLSWFAENHATDEAGLNVIFGSRLLDRRALTSNVTALSHAYERFSDGESSTAFLVSGKGVHNAQPRGYTGNAVLPAWRRAYVHTTLSVYYAPLNATAEAAAKARVLRRVAAMRELAPDMGAYVNE